MTDARYPSLGIRFEAHGVNRQTFALLDTGFDGHLVVPEALVGSLSRPVYVRRVRIASGQVVRVPVYLGTVEFVDHPISIPALIAASSDEHLVGLAMLNHFSVTFDHGHQVIIER